MINELNHLTYLKGNEVLSDSGKAQNLEQSGTSTALLPAGLSKEALALLAKLNIGDFVEGMLTHTQGKYMLQFSKNVQIPVQLSEQMETGKLMQFEVMQKQGQKLLLKTVSSETPMAQKVMEELNLPKNEGMRTLIGAFLEKELPMIKQDLLKAYHMEQKYDIPAKVLANMAASKETLLEEDLNVLHQFKQQGYDKLQEQLKTLLSSTSSTQGQRALFQELKPHIHHDQIKTLINEMLEEVAKNNPDELPKHLLENLKLKGMNTPEQRSEVFKAWAGTYPEAILNNSKWMGKLNEKLLAQVFKKAQLMNESEAMEDVKWQNLNKTLSRLVETLKKEELSEQHKTLLNEMDKNLEVLNKYEASGAYYLVPMETKQKDAGEVYFFKPKKHGKKQEDTFYIVVALQMPALSEVQVHIRKVKQQLSVEIKVKDASIRDFIDEYKEQVTAFIEACGYQAGQVKVSLLNEKQEESTLSQMDAFYHMDLKV